MPTYTFEIRNGKTPLEVIAADCDSLEIVHSEALRLTAESVHDFTPAFWLHPIWSLSVFDEAKTEILKLDINGHSSESGPTPRR